MLNQPTWARVYDEVRRENPPLFNALNLSTLQLGRPSPLEAPESCTKYQDSLDFIAGWRAWYREIDRGGMTGRIFLLKLNLKKENELVF